MFFMQYFCLHSILPFSKLYPEIESTWATTKCSKRRSFDMWYYIVTCATICVSFSSKSKAINVFPKHISEIKSMWPINSSKKKLFCHVIVKNYMCNILQKFFIKIESTWMCKIKKQTPQLTLCYCGRTVRSSQQRCCIRKLFFKTLQYPQKTPVLESIFKKFADL